MFSTPPLLFLLQNPWSVGVDTRTSGVEIKECATHDTVKRCGVFAFHLCPRLGVLQHPQPLAQCVYSLMSVCCRGLSSMCDFVQCVCKHACANCPTEHDGVTTSMLCCVMTFPSSYLPSLSISRILHMTISAAGVRPRPDAQAHHIHTHTLAFTPPPSRTKRGGVENTGLG